jgi:hypothetical protein
MWNNLFFNFRKDLLLCLKLCFSGAETFFRGNMDVAKWGWVAYTTTVGGPPTISMAHDMGNYIYTHTHTIYLY